eukprot:COSAG01_NODE_1986_length_8712_cov_118.329618_7_plen_57_part_00
MRYLGLAPLLVVAAWSALAVAAAARARPWPLGTIRRLHVSAAILGPYMYLMEHTGC